MAAVAMPVDLTGRTIIVTGASPGSIGAETARILAAWGASVLITTRTDTTASAAALGERVTGHRLDLTDAGSVAAFAAWLGDRPVDVLINNAGVHLDLRSKWKRPTMTTDGYEIHWRTNYLGTAQLTAALLPNLSRSSQPRVVNVVSKLHTRASNEQLFAPIEPYDSWVAYGASKLALIHHAGELQRQYAATGLQACSLHPGAVYSRIADKGLANSPVLATVRRAFGPLERRMLLSTIEGAQTSVHCASTPEPLDGHYFRDCAVAEPSAEAGDADVAARLWDRTQEWIARL